MALNFPQQSFELAAQHHQARRFAQAEAIYRQILSQDPNQVDALHMLGLLAHQARQSEAAIQLIRRAIALQPEAAVFHANLGLVQAASGQLDAAIVAYRTAVALQPGFVEAHYNLGNALRQLRRHGEAIVAFRAALALRPDFPEALNNVGTVLRETGQLEEAITAYRQAILIRPGHAEALNNLGNALLAKGETAEALGLFGRAVAARPDFIEALSSLADLLRDKGEFDEAIVLYRRALALQPDLANTHNNLGNVLSRRDQLDEAIYSYHRALSLNPNNAIAYNNLGYTLAALGRIPEAIAAHRRALEIQPDLAEARFNLGQSLLLLGDFAEGWPLYDARLPKKNPQGPESDPVYQNPWNGSPLAGRSIFLQAEQGLGDTIQFVRYVPILAARGAKIILHCPAQLERLLVGKLGIDHIVVDGRPLPPIDVSCRLLSLPRWLGTTVASIPADVPYLSGDAQAMESWRQRLSSVPGMKIGLVWAGSAKHQNDRNRSLNLQSFAPLGQIPNTTFISLQKGSAAKEAASPPNGLRVLDWTDELSDLADTAALISSLDLVISVDTAVAHLTGALGKPVWVLIPFAPDWRWMLSRTDSPWYPTMRLFRQPRLRDWQHPISQIAAELTKANRTVSGR